MTTLHVDFQVENDWFAFPQLFHGEAKQIKGRVPASPQNPYRMRRPVKFQSVQQLWGVVYSALKSCLTRCYRLVGINLTKVPIYISCQSMTSEDLNARRDNVVRLSYTGQTITIQSNTRDKGAGEKTSAILRNTKTPLNSGCGEVVPRRYRLPIAEPDNSFRRRLSSQCWQCRRS